MRDRGLAGERCTVRDRFRRALRNVRRRLESRHESLQDELDEFDLRHLTIARFACLPGPPPVTIKGNVAAGTIEQRHHALLDALLGKDVRHHGHRLHRSRPACASRARRAWPPSRGPAPSPAATRQALRRRPRRPFDAGRPRYAPRGGRLRGRLRDDAARSPSSRCDRCRNAVPRHRRGPCADQGSDRPEEGAFARRLAQAVARRTGGSYVVRLGSTGAEAVEMALSHAFLSATSACAGSCAISDAGLAARARRGSRRSSSTPRPCCAGRRRGSSRLTGHFTAPASVPAPCRSSAGLAPSSSR